LTFLQVRACKSGNMSTSEAVESRLDLYLSLVSRWAPRLDLVAPRDLSRFRARHIDDCLRLLPLSDAVVPGAAVDIGSGAGLPGIVLAMARPGRPWRLLEPRSKRAGFLEEVVRELGLDNVEVRPVTAEDAARDRVLRRAHVLAVARAVAPPDRSFELLAPLTAPGGTAAVFAGKTAEIPPGAKEWGRGIFIRVAPEGTS
jgi:16S rRNA (guanine527-N7)-methyltransferase